ncbi:hypothetical protein Syun_028326 [Stephania yunnanensis]|uniref:Uncharacterized protein n=1 Tax=Stephania yunnanensis TaxID=152371 RepID=A0AAP0EH57_9MAGN
MTRLHVARFDWRNPSLVTRWTKESSPRGRTLEPLESPENHRNSRSLCGHVSGGRSMEAMREERMAVEDYLIDTSEECEVFQIEPEIIIALNEGEDEMKIDVNSDKPEKPQIESEEHQPLALVQPPTLPCTFGTPYKGVKVRKCLQIFYTGNTFVLDDPDTIDSFVLEVPNELLNMKEGGHASLPNYVDAPFVVDISKGEGIM